MYENPGGYHGSACPPLPTLMAIGTYLFVKVSQSGDEKTLSVVE